MILLLLTLTCLDCMTNHVLAQTCDTCQSDACSAALNRIVTPILNSGLDPCSDFYEFACAPWRQETRIPQNKPEISTLLQVKDKVDKVLIGLLKSDDSSGLAADAKMFYAQCLDTLSHSKTGIKPLLKIFERYGEWPMLTSQWHLKDVKFERMLGELYADFGVDIILKPIIQNDPKDPTQRVLRISDTKMGIGPLNWYFNPQFGQQRQLYADLIAHFVSLVAQDLPGPGVAFDAVQQLSDMIDFEIRLAQAHAGDEERNDDVAMYNKFTISELEARFPNFDWRTYFGAFLSDEAMAHSEHNVIIEFPQHLEQLIGLLHTSPTKAIYNHVMWEVIRKLTQAMDHRFYGAVDRYMQVVQGGRGGMDREQHCLRLVHHALDMEGFSQAVAGMYVETTSNVERRDLALELTNEVLDAFRDRVRDIDWLDDETKSRAQEKADSIIGKVGYQDWLLDSSHQDDYYSDLEVSKDNSFFDNWHALQKWSIQKRVGLLVEPFDRNRMYISPAQANTFYDLGKNAVIIPAGFLESPIFETDLPDAYNLGSLGAMIGHEITHSVDNRGRRFNQFGELHDWWTPESEASYNSKLQCVMDQYSQYTVPEVGRPVNGRVTVGENVADQGGLRTAYDVFIKMANTTSCDSDLQAAHGITQEQLFFIGYGRLWCAKERPQVQMMKLLMDVHAPPRFRVNGPLSTMQEFNEAFGCPVGSPMNRVFQNCDLW